MDFVDGPPEHKRKALSEKWLMIVQGLKENPNTWARVGTYSPGTATAIRRGRYVAFLEDCPDDTDPEVWMSMHYEVTTRRVDDGRRNDIYIRYIP